MAEPATSPRDDKSFGVVRYYRSSQTSVEIADYPVKVDSRRPSADSLLSDSDYEPARCCALCLSVREGICYMILGVTAISLASLWTKLGFNRSYFSPCEVVYFRSAFSVIGNILYGLCTFDAHSPPLLHVPKDSNLLTLRAAMGAAAQLCFVVALLHLDFLRAIILSFASRLFAELSDRLRRCPKLSSILGCSLSLLWVCMLARPDAGVPAWAPGLSLLGSVFAAVAYLLAKRGGSGSEVNYLVPPVWTGTAGAVASSLGMLEGVRSAQSGLWNLLGISALGWVGQLLQGAALRKEAGWRLSVTMLLMLGYGMLFQFLAFNAAPAWADLAGIGILVVSDVMSAMK